MSTTTTQPVTKAFNVIDNGEITGLSLSNWPEFYEATIRKAHKFGHVAQAAGEAPIKAVVVFKDGNIQGLRGDRYNAIVIDMVRGLRRTILGYHSKNKIVKVTMYDNRGYLPDGRKLILQWEIGKGTTVNYLPLYLPEEKINP